MPDNSMIVDGFLFTDEDEAKQAKKESDGVAHIRQKTEMDNPEMVLYIYNKMIQQRLFETAVGYVYLKELQDYLFTMPFIKREEILPIPVQHPQSERSLRRAKRAAAPKTEPQEKTRSADKNTNYKRRYRIMRWVTVILAVCVVAMFAITATSNNATILNYENQIINKYESWEDRLNERQKSIDAKERELGIGVDVQ